MSILTKSEKTNKVQEHRRVIKQDSDQLISRLSNLVNNLEKFTCFMFTEATTQDEVELAKRVIDMEDVAVIVKEFALRKQALETLIARISNVGELEVTNVVDGQPVLNIPATLANVEALKTVANYDHASYSSQFESDG